MVILKKKKCFQRVVSYNNSSEPTSYSFENMDDRQLCFLLYVKKIYIFRAIND